MGTLTQNNLINVFTTKPILKALYTCASTEESRLACNGISKLKDGRVFSTDGRRLVVFKHESFDNIEAGHYMFKGKPVYNKTFAEIVLIKDDLEGPNIDQVLFSKGDLVCSHVFENKYAGINRSKLMFKIFDKTKTALNFDLLDFFPDNEVFDIYVRDIKKSDGVVMFKEVNSNCEMQALICPIRWDK